MKQLIEYMFLSETWSPQLEPSLADLQQRALFLPRSSLQNLQEIGEGAGG